MRPIHDLIDVLQHLLRVVSRQRVQAQQHMAHGARQLKQAMPKLLVSLLRTLRLAIVCAAIWSINLWIGKETKVNNPATFGAMMLGLEVAIVWLGIEVNRWVNRKKR